MWSSRKARIDAGLTLQELASAIDVDKSNLSKWERGERGLPQDSVARLAEVLTLDARELLIEVGLVELLGKMKENILKKG